MNEIFIYNANIVFADKTEKGKSLLVKNGKIDSIDPDAVGGEAVRIDARNMYLSAGFVDIHLHGGGGSDFMDGTEEAYQNAVNAHLMHGTTSLAPTILGSSREEILRAVRVFRKVKESAGTGERLLGLHLEGPYISINQAGAQPPQYIRKPQREEYEEIIKEGGGNIVRWSYAPETDGALELAKYLRENGILPSIAHSDADYGQVLKAFEEGFSLITHLYSAMSTIKRVNGFRVLGVIESAYLIDDINVEVIADGAHLPPELLKFICKFKNHDNIVLITDAMRASGQDVTSSYLGTKEQGVPCVIEDGVAKLFDRSAFAGSVATADRLIRTMVKGVGLSLCDAVKMITVNPLKALGSKLKKGEIKQGYDADLVIFDENINVKTVIAGGKIVKQK